MRLSSSRALPAAVLALSLALTGCGGDEKKSGPSDGPSASAEPTVPPEPPTWPLTGVEAAAGEEVEQDHPVVVAKIDNSPASSPQVGLSKADLVVEELVEGGITRLAAFYYSKLPAEVGPVRSMRASDIGIVKPVDAVITTSGAAQITINRINKAGITFFQEGGPGMYRNNSRRAPYNLFTNLKKVGKAVEDDKSERPADYLPWAKDGAVLPVGQPAPTLVADFGGRRTNWKFETDHYVNTNSFAAQGDRFKPSTVLVLRVEVVDAGYKDPAGNYVPETKLSGGGPAQIFHGGQVIDAEWSKAKNRSQMRLTAADGTEIAMPPGKTWIELVPVDSAGGAVTVGQ